MGTFLQPDRLSAMRAGTHRNPRFYALALAILALIAPLTPSASAQSLYRYAPATAWGYTFAGPATQVTTTSTPKSANLEKQSTIEVNYTNFPEWAKRELQAAVDIWAANFQSKVTVTVDATWSNSQSVAVLGSARPGGYFAGFSGAPDSSLWYPSALANALAGKDLDIRNSEMVINVNARASWNRRGDGAPTRSEYDLKSVFIHEMGHGLGFLSNDVYDDFSGFGSIEQPTPFDAFAQTAEGKRLADLPSPSLELGKALRSPLYWAGAKAIAANGGVKPLLYTPNVYEVGSSVSHLDEKLFTNAGSDSVMTPDLDAGEVFAGPGPLLLAMMADMRSKPPVGVAVELPQAVRNAQAVIGASSAIVKWDPPANLRTAQVTAYTVKNLRTGAERSATTSPVLISGLKNGTTYTFSIVANNSLGSSPVATTDVVTPQPAWKSEIIDPNVEPAHIATTTFNKRPVVVYSNGVNGILKMAVWNGLTWRKTTIDGAGGTNRTSHEITSPISLCIGGTGSNQKLHMFYADAVDQDLRHATFDGKKVSVEIVDGNGPSVNKYEDPVRVRTASDVSISNACVITPTGIQVFYRDESQGVLLGAYKLNNSSRWSYEMVDGDRKTDGRTIGDVAFHLAAGFDGKKTYVLYDSVLVINQRKEATSGAIRLATRNEIDPSKWAFRTLEQSGDSLAMTGYDVALSVSSKSAFAMWLGASSTTIPKPSQIRTAVLTPALDVKTFDTSKFGTPNRWMRTNARSALFNCEDRLCSIDFATKKISLITNSSAINGTSGSWVVRDGKTLVVANINGNLAIARP
jgi:hypothetical protein